MPGLVGQYVEATSEVERYAREYGQHWVTEGDLLENIKDVRRAFPEETYTEAIRHGVELTKHEIADNAAITSESEFQSEARSRREGIHIDQFHARHESPSETVDRQFTDATEIEKLQMTESKLGLGHSRSEKLITDYGRNAERESGREKESPSFREAFRNTTERLHERYFNAATSNGWDASSGQSTPWTNAQDREVVRQLAHSENQFIAKAQFETPGGRYQTDDKYRHGAREAVMEFSRENNHRLMQSDREKESPQESIRMRDRESGPYSEGFANTYSRLEQQRFDRATDWDAMRGGKAAPYWSHAEERQAIDGIATAERRAIAQSVHEHPGSRYAVDQSYTKGAREAVAAFQEDHMQRLAETEGVRESIRMRVG